MNKQEFLAELRKNLGGLPKEEVEDRINFYEEMINDRMDEGKTEEEAIADIGTTDDAVKVIASQTKMVTLVREKMKPKRSMTGLEIALLILGFPLWFPLLIVGFVLLLVGYLLLWIMAIVTYAIEAGFVASFVATLVDFGGFISNGEFNMMVLGTSLLSLGFACLFVFACIRATKMNYKITKRIFLSIKTKIIKRG